MIPRSGYLADVLDGVDHRRAEVGSVRYGLDQDRRLAVRPLLESGVIELNYHALAMAVPRPRLPRRKLFFEHEKLRDHRRAAY